MNGEELIRSARFRKEREADWRRLEQLVQAAESRGLQQMNFAETRDLASLYRQATTPPAIAREISLDKALLGYLEALTARAYLCVYAPQQRLGGLAARFCATGAPRAIRRCWLYILLGFLCMGLGALAGYLLYFENNDWFYVFMPSELSGGQQKRVCIARALAAEPEIIIFDEAVSGLDMLVRKSILDLLKRLHGAQSAACLFITHDIDVALYLADRILVMKDGEIIERVSYKGNTKCFVHPYSQLLLNAMTTDA